MFSSITEEEGKKQYLHVKVSMKEIVPNYVVLKSACIVSGHVSDQAPGNQVALSCIILCCIFYENLDKYYKIIICPNLFDFRFLEKLRLKVVA